MGEQNRFYGRKHTKETLQKIITAVHGKPNNAEKRLIEICDTFNIPFKFVGNGSLIIDGLNPDFVSQENPSLLMELFGRYWHQLKKGVPYHKTEAGKIARYENLGYKCLIVWEEELLNPEQVARKVRQFLTSESLEVVR